MPIGAEQQKQDAIDAAVALAARKGDKQAAMLQRFLRQFYDHAPPEDIVPRSAEELCEAALSLWRFAEMRPSGCARLRAFNPRRREQGWHVRRTIVEIVNDDMPFLVDSVVAALNGRGIPLHLVIHPVLRIKRDAAGRVIALLDPEPADGMGRESFMYLEIAELGDPHRLAELEALMENVLRDVRAAVEDWPRMRTVLQRVRGEIARHPPPLPPEERSEALDFLGWLDEDNFTFLGYREYHFAARSEAPPSIPGELLGGLDIVPGSGLGILRDERYAVFDGLRNFATLPPEVRDFLRQPRLLLVTKSSRPATVHRAVPMDAIGIKIFDADGMVAGERFFVGLFTSLAYRRQPQTVPLLRRKVNGILQRASLEPSSHDGKALLHILDTFPRDELFQIAEAELRDMALGILNVQERPRTALFVHRDPFGHFVSCLVYVPRERYDTDLRRRFAAILEAAFHAKVGTFDVQLDADALGRIHYILRTTPGAIPEVDIAAVDRQLGEAARSWADRLSQALVEDKGEQDGLALLRRYADAFPSDYRERFSAATALYDIDRIEEVRAGLPLGMTLYRAAEAPPAELCFKIYRAGTPVALSDILPMLEHMGLKAIAEMPYAITPVGDAAPVWMQDLSLLAPQGAIDVARERDRFEAAFARVWSGEMESDGFNRLVLAAGLDWRQIVVLRLYAKVMRQAGSTFSQAYMEDALARHPATAAKLVQLFERRFDPRATVQAAAETACRTAEIERDLEQVTSLDEDRILRSFLSLIGKTLRTNHFQRRPDGTPKPYLAVKLASGEIDLFPLPRPLCEIYVYGPRVEGVHMRGGMVARGGIRWSDRKEDFRTEILGLMKAQMVKNAVIVPTGAKGGFVVKRMPAAHDEAGRAALGTEVVECYKTLMRGLLDLTDNIVGGTVVPPPEVVRHDGDDPYLVVAADKGTATFSDIANAVSAEYGFWLGDAFASGGSAGYDHKAIGITARGAWETVKRHFRELGTDIQAKDFTVVGIGDMSGDVFGNGMLCSPHIRLVAAFNHRHVFLDPDPDPATSLVERRRLFALPGSSWADYDRALISPGGGVFERDAKSIPLSPEMRVRLNVSAERLPPAGLIRAVLKASVDLLWFGGIGTYVKASHESHAEVGDRANDALRIDATDLRARVVGEGANLAVTQRGRIEYALEGGRINTDAIDNSAGVDTSDHEVNLKILLDVPVGRGEITVAERNALLHEMTGEVAALVLRDNYLQGLALTLAEAQRLERFEQQVRLMRELERAGNLNRAVEFLPDDETLAARAVARQGLPRPELAVLMAYVKNTLTDELALSDLPDDRLLERELLDYFPHLLAERFRGAIEHHPLRRDIIATVVANELVNRGGITFVQELCEHSGRGPADVARAYAITREVFDLAALWMAIEALDGKVPASLQTEMLLSVSRLLERAAAWFLRLPLMEIGAQIETYRPGVATLASRLDEILPQAHREMLRNRIEALTGRGVPGELAARVASLDLLVSAVDIVRLGQGRTLDPIEPGRRFFAIGARFRLDTLRLAAGRLKTETSWQKLALDTLVEDLYASQAKLTAEAAAARDFDVWLDGQARRLARLDAIVREIETAPAPDLAMLTVANRVLRGVLVD